MNLKCGIDIIEIERIKQSIETIGKKFLKRVFTKQEIEYCESKKSQKYQHYAARFAAKEAIFKAVSEVLNDKYSLNWTDFEVVNDKQGRPKVNIYNKELQNINQIDISISHCKQYAVANVIIMIETNI